jgi:hypothetical protein
MKPAAAQRYVRILSQWPPPLIGMWEPVIENGAYEEVYKEKTQGLKGGCQPRIES